MMKRAVLFCLCSFLFVSGYCGFACNDSIRESWAVDERGNLVALLESNGWELAEYLNTSLEIVLTLLEQQGLQRGDSSDAVIPRNTRLVVDYGLALTADTLSGIGKVICKQLDEGWDKYLFARYWSGRGNLELTCSQFVGILLSIRQLRDRCPLCADTLIAGGGKVACMVSFYNTQYEQCFGKSTIKMNEERRIVGFSDIYDFDTKKCGERPLVHEIYVRLVSLCSPVAARAFRIFYGEE